MRFQVFLTDSAVVDLQSLVGEGANEDSFVVEEFRRQLQLLETNPFTCRVADSDPFERELIVPVDLLTGYVALFEIVNEDIVIVTAFRELRDQEYLLA